ncbi:MAG: hypothetical protein J7452_07645 [Thermoflexus sp.]|jgi:hypothetical protein|nr:hypothetical protein [Thermoflexus sp.]
MIEVAEVFIWSNKAYLPVLGKTEVGFFWEAGPLLTSELTVDALAAALEEIVKIGNPAMRHPTQAEFRRLTPVQKAIGIRSWKKMAQAGVIRFGIWWTKEKILVAFSPRGAKDVQEMDFAHQRGFPPETPLRVIAGSILQEVRAREAMAAEEG